MKKMMTSTSLKILKTLVIVNIIVIFIIVIFFDIKYLYALEIGFVSSSLVMFASLAAYKRMVDVRVEHNIITFDDSKDVIDQLEDPYDLYSEDVSKEASDNLEEIAKEGRKKRKDHRSLYQILKDTKAALSVYRLGAYALLILGFLYLNRQGLLHIPTYIFALGLAPIVIVVLFLREKETQTEDTLQ